MTVYVDDMFTSELGRLGRMKMSHMIADSDEELHAMALRIGVQRRWFQKPDTPGRHYDIALSMRARAVAAGAVEITMQQCSAMVRCREFTGELGDPATARVRRDAHLEARRAARAATPIE